GATGVPSRLWGPGIKTPGVMASYVEAERVARQLLADHLALLAPGASVDDFTLAANHYDGDIRSIGFVQSSGGRRVLGGQISFRFKNDRLFVIASEALPNVSVPAAHGKRLAPAALVGHATEHARTELDLAGAPVTAGADEVILPLVSDDAVLGYRVAVPATIDGGVDGKYLAYVDPTTGAVLALHQTNLYATGVVSYRSVDRQPMRPRRDRTASHANVMLNGVPQTTNAGGVVTWSPDTVQTVTTGVTGPFVTIVNKGASAALAATELSLSPGGAVVWDASATEEDDAQVVTFIATNTVKEFVRRHLDPAMPKLDDALIANVNISQNCNAFFDGKNINFFHASMNCQNTGRLEDVVFHEFGHFMHASEIISGVGAFEGAMSEGASDFLAAMITGDSGMGRGFFYTEEPLRELDPPDKENVWPTDIGEIHHTGKIYGGAMWDMRKALIAQYGEERALPIIGKIFVGTLRRSTSIPTSLLEALAADDDDGDVSNGTPNECAIRDAFARHGLRTATGIIVAPGVVRDNARATVVRADMTGTSERCSGDDIASVRLKWRPSYTGVPESGSMEMERVDTNRFWGNLPLAVNESVFYSATVNFVDGSTMTLPDNMADKDYQTYQGNTVKLYCTDFEKNPFLDGWKTGAKDGKPSPWQWGTPTGIGGATDPPSAYSGSKILAQVLDGDYLSASSSYAQLPDINVGQYSDVRLQFRRWLAVEDSEFDQARVTVNGQQAWVNFTAKKGQSSAIHHIDKEWRFTDVALSYHTVGHTMKIAFDLTTDEGLQLGGWQIDDLCVVANTASICGDGVRQTFEQCDEGEANADVAGATCRTWCQRPKCGDFIVDGNEECDAGPGGDGSCSELCRIIPEENVGCCSANGGTAGPLALSLFAGAWLFRPRRRRSR
ncbi:MAG: M36 family metallopeptidase, partial [Deltaproteobacteria bacterium]|nr:M36 family metallopeptidase [Deltaproteobacteria bacterium]